MTTKTGTNFTSGATDLSAQDYTVQTVNVGGNDVDMEEFFDGVSGSRSSIFVYNNDDKISLEMLTTKTESQVKADFPEHAKATATGYTDYWVTRCNIQHSRSAMRVQVDLVNKGV